MTCLGVVILNIPFFMFIDLLEFIVESFVSLGTFLESISLNVDAVLFSPSLLLLKLSYIYRKLSVMFHVSHITIAIFTFV